MGEEVDEDVPHAVAEEEEVGLVPQPLSAAEAVGGSVVVLKGAAKPVRKGSAQQGEAERLAAITGVSQKRSNVFEQLCTAAKKGWGITLCLNTVLKQFLQPGEKIMN